MSNKKYTLVAWTEKGQVRMIPSLVNEASLPYREKIHRIESRGDVRDKVGFLLAQSRAHEEFARFLLSVGHPREAYVEFENAAEVCTWCPDELWNYGDEGLKTVWCSGYRLAFVRVAGHYAKARFSFPGRSWDLGFPEDAFHPVDEMALNNEDFSFLIDLEMYVNAEAGDRHLSESY